MLLILISFSILSKKTTTLMTGMKVLHLLHHRLLRGRPAEESARVPRAEKGVRIKIQTNQQAEPASGPREAWRDLQNLSGPLSPPGLDHCHQGQISLNSFFIIIWLSSLGGLPKKTFFFGISFPNVGGWGCWFPNKVQTPQNPPKFPRKSPFSTQISPFVSQISQKPWGGWLGKQIWERYPKKKRFFFGSFPNSKRYTGKSVLATKMCLKG